LNGLFFVQKQKTFVQIFRKHRDNFLGICRVLPVNKEIYRAFLPFTPFTIDAESLLYNSKKPIDYSFSAIYLSAKENSHIMTLESNHNMTIFMAI